MIPGTTLHSPTTVYTDWMERGGDNVIVQFDVIDTAGGVNLKAQLYTRETDGTGDGTALGTASTLSGTGRKEISNTEQLNDLVRLKLEVPTALSTGPEWVYFRILGLVWYDTADA